MPLGYPIYVSPILVSSKPKLISGLAKSIGKKYSKYSKKKAERARQKRSRALAANDWRLKYQGDRAPAKEETLEMTAFNAEFPEPIEQNNIPASATNENNSSVLPQTLTRARESINNISSNLLSSVKSHIEHINPMTRIHRARSLHIAKTGSDHDIYELKNELLAQPGSSSLKNEKLNESQEDSDDNKNTQSHSQHQTQNQKVQAQSVQAPTLSQKLPSKPHSPTLERSQSSPAGKINSKSDSPVIYKSSSTTNSSKSTSEPVFSEETFMAAHIGQSLPKSSSSKSKYRSAREVDLGKIEEDRMMDSV